MGEENEPIERGQRTLREELEEESLTNLLEAEKCVHPDRALYNEERLQTALGFLIPVDYAPGLSATTVTRLKAIWEEEYRGWSKRSLGGKQYVYVWADGVYFNIGLEEGRQCILVLMGATPDERKN